MADFSFLNTEQEDNGFFAAGARKPVAADPKFTPLSGDTGEQEEMGQGPGQTPEVHGPDEAAKFQQKRGKAADFAKKQTLGALDRLAQIHDSSMRSGNPSPLMGSVDYEGTKAKILTSPPEKYAETLYQEAKKHQPWLGDSGVGEVMRPSEDAVTSYKQLQLENQAAAQQVQQSMVPGDVQNARAQLASLDQTIEQTKQRMALSATSRQRDELKRGLDFYESQKRVLQAKIPAEPEAKGEGIQDSETTIDHALTAAGHPRADAIQSLAEMRRMVEIAGISASAPVSPLSFIPTYTNLIAHIFNPDVRDKMLGEMAPPPQEEAGEPPASRMPEKGGEQKSTFGSDKLEQDPRFQRNQQMIDQRENRHQQIMQELANSGTFKNVGDVLGFVLTSFLLGPKVAALFFSNMQKNGNLRDELNRLDHETTQLYHQQNSYIQLAQHARAQAASEEHAKQVERENVRHNWAVEHYARGAKANVTALSQEDKQIHQALQASLRDHWSEVQQQERKVKRMDAIQGRGDPRDPDWKFVQANLSKERGKLQEMEQTYLKFRMERVAPWYAKRGIEFVDPNKGTQVTQDTFAPHE